MPSALTVEAITGSNRRCLRFWQWPGRTIFCRCFWSNRYLYRLVLELLEVAYPGTSGGRDNTPILPPVRCLETGGLKTQDLGTIPPPAVEAFNQIAEQVNLCLWQIDNTFALAQTHHTYSVGGRLAEYGLLYGRRFNATRDSKTISSLMSKERQYDSIQEIVRDALQDQRFEMLKAWRWGSILQ